MQSRTFSGSPFLAIDEARKNGIRTIGADVSPDSLSVRKFDEVREKTWAEKVVDLINKNKDAKVLLLAGGAHTVIVNGENSRLTTILRQNNLDPFSIDLSPTYSSTFSNAVWKAGLADKKFAVPEERSGDRRDSDYLVHLPNAAQEEFDLYIALADRDIRAGAEQRADSPE